MKYILLYMVFAIAANKTFAQAAEESVSYLVIKIKTERDYKKKVNFCFLEIEKGNTDAGQLYALATYKNKSSHEDAVYDSESKDKENPGAETGINYFENTTAALNYLGQSGWYLDTVVPNISSSLDTDIAGGERANYTKITSDPQFIFKKIFKK